MKLDKEVVQPATKKIFFPTLRRKQVEPVENDNTLQDRSIIGWLVQKISGESTFFNVSSSYSPQKRSKSLERGMKPQPIKPFTQKPSSDAAVLKTFKNLEADEPHRDQQNGGLHDVRRLSHPNLCSDQPLKISKINSKKRSNDLRQSDNNIMKSNHKASEQKNKKDCVSISQTQHQNTNSAPGCIVPHKVLALHNHISKPFELDSTRMKGLHGTDGDLQKEQSDGDSISSNLKLFFYGGSDWKENAEIVSLEPEVKEVTRIKIKYSGPVNHDEKKLPDPCLHEKFQGKSHTSNDLSGHYDTSVNENSSLDINSFTNVTNKQVVINDPQSASPSRPGKLLIRPASNLAAAKTMAEFLNLTKFTDVKTGEFAAPSKPKKQKKVEDDYFDFDEESSCKNDVSEKCKEANEMLENEEATDYDFIGAGVIQGKSVLAKTKSNKAKSVLFNEDPTVHLIEGRYDNDPCDESDADNESLKLQSHVVDGTSTNLFSSLTNGTSNGYLSTYKSKSLVDFEFDFNSPPPVVTPQTTTQPSKEDGVSPALNSSDALLWSSNNTLDLLF